MHKFYPSIIGTLAFGFQVLVLEPWHQQISNEIKELRDIMESK